MKYIVRLVFLSALVAAPVTLRLSAQGKSPIADLTLRVQTLEQQVQALQQQSALLTTNLNALNNNLNALNAQLASIGAELADVAQSTQGTRAALTALQARLSSIESAIAGGLVPSFDQLAGRPCTTSSAAAGSVFLTGLFKSAICAVAVSNNGRYINLGPVVIDTQTHLMWDVKDHSGGLHDVGKAYNWCQATGSTNGVCAGNTISWIGQVNAAEFAGFHDWRMPTIDELTGSFIDTTAPNCGGNGPYPCVNPAFGPAAFGLHWAATELQPGGMAAWMANTFRGLVTVHTETSIFSAGGGPFVRAVRSAM